MDRARRLARQQLISLRRCGVETMELASGGTEFDLRPDSQSVHSDLVDQTALPGVTHATGGDSGVRPASAEAKNLFPANQDSVWQQPPLPVADRVNLLQIIEKEVADCTQCSELAAARSKTVFGVGNPSAELCFLGEGPGAEEDRKGEPFVGAAGQLLDKILAACKLNRDEVYILNTVKCRPPNNRNPEEDELSHCWPFAVRQLEIIQPKFICCLGSVAAKTLLATKQSIGRMRGQFFEFRGSQVIVTYHPAYLLRNPGAKRQVWDDMKMLMKAMGREI